MVDPVNNSMTTVSVPRASYVPNPAYNNGSDKLTHLGNDGADNSILGLEEAFGIEIDYYAKVNFQCRQRHVSGHIFLCRFHELVDP